VKNSVLITKDKQGFLVKDHEESSTGFVKSYGLAIVLEIFYMAICAGGVSAHRQRIWENNVGKRWATRGS
jgi:hypothetical protein